MAGKKGSVIPGVFGKIGSKTMTASDLVGQVPDLPTLGRRGNIPLFQACGA